MRMLIDGFAELTDTFYETMKDRSWPQFLPSLYEVGSVHDQDSFLAGSGLSAPCLLPASGDLLAMLLCFFLLNGWSGIAM